MLQQVVHTVTVTRKEAIHQLSYFMFPTVDLIEGIEAHEN